MNDFKSFTIQELEQQEKSNVINYALSSVDKIKNEFGTDSEILSVGIFEPQGYYPFIYVTVRYNNQHYVSTVSFEVSGIMVHNNNIIDVTFCFKMKGDSNE